MKTGLLPQLRKPIPAGKRLAAVALGILSLMFIIPAVAGIGSTNRRHFLSDST